MVTLNCLRRALPRAAMAALAATLLGASLAACYHPPTGLANCYEDLPLAEAVLNAPRGSYVFHGVKVVLPKEMVRLVARRFPHAPGAKTSLAAKPGTHVCAFAFTGRFAAGQVAGSPARAAGNAAVVLVTTDRQLLFSFVLAKLPESFSKEFTGP